MNNLTNKTFGHRPIGELMAIVKQDFKKFDDEGLIDEGTIIKTVMYCNDRLGVNIRKIEQVCIPVEDYKAKLPLNFEKLYFICALRATNGITVNMTNPFNNNFDRDTIYEAKVDRDSLGGTQHYNITVKREQNVTLHTMGEWIPLTVDASSISQCHISSPHLRKKGKYIISLNDGYVDTPFRSGEIYIMYLATMCDDDGNLLFPFHPMITPYYEWSIKEKIVLDAIFNSDVTDGNLLAIAQREKAKAWLDAFDMTTSKAFGEYVAIQKKKELGWYNQYFKYFQ